MRRKKLFLYPYVLLLPAVITTFSLMIYPLLYGIWISFHFYDLTLPHLGRPFIGLKNYIEMVKKRGCRTYVHHPILDARHWGIVDGKDVPNAVYHQTHSCYAVASFHEALRIILGYGRRRKASDYAYHEKALRQALVDRGFAEKPKAEADVLISYDVGAYAAARVSGQSSIAKRDGGITVWVYDRKTGNQVWYGWSERPLSPTDEPEPTINDAVQAIFQDRMPENQ